jgi:hypothetical protein
MAYQLKASEEKWRKYKRRKRKARKAAIERNMNNESGIGENEGMAKIMAKENGENGAGVIIAGNHQ